MKNNNKLINNDLKRISLDLYKVKEKANIILIIDNIRSAMNVGSIFRTADAFCIEKIYLCGITAIPPNKDLLKSALGATESIEWEYWNHTSEIVNELKKLTTVKIIGIEQTQMSIPLNNFIPQTNQKLVLILGNEIEGVDQNVINLCDDCLEIPQYGTKHSFNVAVSAGIVLWDVYSKMYLNKELDLDT